MAPVDLPIIKWPSLKKVLTTCFILICLANLTNSFCKNIVQSQSRHIKQNTQHAFKDFSSAVDSLVVCVIKNVNAIFDEVFVVP